MTVGAPPSGVGELERRYLSGTFAELCRIESPSGRERACAERVSAELRALDLQVLEDDAGPSAGSDCGNLLARIPAAHPPEGARSGVMLCAHLDTVPLAAAVEPVLEDGFWVNANEGILGADNKAAVAVLLTLARHIHREGAAIDVELLFTVGEERSLAGAQAFDASRLRSEFGFVFDHASPIGEVIVASPTHFKVDASFRGAATHAGVRPEEGSSAILAACRGVAAIEQGRLDERSTCNVGTISGGTAINVVPERCSLEAEVRSLREERAEQIVTGLVDSLHEAANHPDSDCDLDVSVRRTFSGYELPAQAPALQVARAALRACGHEPLSIASGGGSDANALIAQGFQTVNLANGTERNHEPDERVSVAALEQMLDVSLALLREAAAPPRPAL